MSDPAEVNVARLEAALDSGVPDAVHALAVELRDSGLAPSELYAVFDAVRARHRDDVDERKYDAVLDVMDLIVGWCAPGERLYRRE
jgi:hypothetical protein